jgi:hypothetical protein
MQLAFLKNQLAEKLKNRTKKIRQAHRSTTLSLLCFHPGEVRQELVA